MNNDMSVATLEGAASALARAIKLEKERRSAELADFQVPMIALCFGLSHTTDHRDRLRAARILYWECEAPAWAVKAGLLAERLAADADHETVKKTFRPFDRLFFDMIGPAAWAPCQTKGCDGEIAVRSRSALKLWQQKSRRRPISYTQVDCNDCIARQKAREKANRLSPEEWAAIEADRKREYAAKVAELRALEARTGLKPAELARMYSLMHLGRC